MEADILKQILDGREKPSNLPFALLKNITEHFSEDRVIGHGGFATVYEGVLPNGRVAVKRIRNNHSIDEKLFYREVDSLLTIDHKNVVRFLGFCASTDQTAIRIEGSRQHIYAEIRERLLCFEYMSNGSLQKHITDELRGLEWNARYEIIKGICEGLHHLHKEKHIYHMDLKPANILLDNQMMPKITDFGLSRLDEKSQTMSEDRCGSLGYCAPEYLCSGKMSFKSDMFSLGVIITQLVTGSKGILDNNKNNVLRRWRHRWKKSGKETPLMYQQVAKCIEIGLLCQEINPSKRPFIWDIIHDIREMEAANGKISTAYEHTVGQISPYSEDDMLGVEPLVLHFPFELNKQISCSLKLTNQTDAYIAFNILNMSPLLYCTQPNKDIVPPRSKCSVDITLQAQDKAPRDMRHADEFIVQSTKVNDGLAADDITAYILSNESGVVDAVNLDVVFDVEESTKANDGLAAVDITANIFNKQTFVVDKMPGVAWPSLYPVRGTSPLLAGLLPLPARSTPRRFFKRPFPPPSLSKHIKARLAKRLGGGKPKEGTIPEEGVVGAAASGALIRDEAEAEILLDKTFGFRKKFGATYELRKKVDINLANVKKGEYKGQTISQTKVYKRGAVGQSIDISQYAGYDELKHALARMFSIEGHLEEGRRIGWKLVYVDHENDVLLLGDDPWEEFVNCVKCIRILSPQEVQQMNLVGDLGNESSPKPDLLQLGLPGRNFGATCQLGKDVGRGSAVMKKGEYKEQTVAVKIISTTKVYKRGAVGQSIDISQYAGYDELKHALARMFSIEGHLEEGRRIGWKLVYVDHENDVLLLGDDPWEKFVRRVKCIRILSPQEVQQMNLVGDLGNESSPKPDLLQLGLPGRNFGATCQLGKDVGRGSAVMKKGEYKEQTVAVKIISTTKVYKRGAVGQSIDISQYAGYDELKHALARMFSIEGHLEEGRRIGWKLVYVDHENDVLLLGDDPWEKFVRRVKCIRILSPQEVQQLSLGGDVGTNVLPNQPCSSSDGGGNV